MIEKEMEIETSIVFDNNRENIVVDNWNVYTSNDIYKKIFGHNKNDEKSFLKKNRIVKIKSIDTNKTIYRLWKGSPFPAKSKNILYVDKNAKYELIFNKNSNKSKIQLSKGSVFAFYWNHFDNSTRVSYKLGFWSVILGIISLALGFLSILLSCL